MYPRLMINYHLIFNNSGDSYENYGMAYMNGMHFSTKDVDRDPYPEHCAQLQHGAWWYSHCGGVNLNGNYIFNSR